MGCGCQPPPQLTPPPPTIGRHLCHNLNCHRSLSKTNIATRLGSPRFVVNLRLKPHRRPSVPSRFATRSVPFRRGFISTSFPMRWWLEPSPETVSSSSFQASPEIPWIFGFLPLCRVWRCSPPR
ncbi:hypothetical protein V6N11_067822 [Hibiscus sabdariffa]|uniref:Uncharacterized protein n=1 Tax=Hibiscus sabdariffa TaxID=183260 RepID=A0ABR2SS98_9ROSI